MNSSPVGYVESEFHVRVRVSLSLGLGNADDNASQKHENQKCCSSSARNESLSAFLDQSQKKYVCTFGF